jgi:4a-hydroxytetrahydrobiopterin dehydratase
MTTQLTNKSCEPCAKAATALKGDAIKESSSQLDAAWTVVDEHHLERDYTFKDFREALAFTNRVGEIAENEGHHPDIYLSWGKVGLKIWTHSVGGLSENDFVLAAKVDSIG